MRTTDEDPWAEWYNQGASLFWRGWWLCAASSRLAHIALCVRSLETRWLMQREHCCRHLLLPTPAAADTCCCQHLLLPAATLKGCPLDYRTSGSVYSAALQLDHRHCQPVRWAREQQRPQHPAA